jgi:hypothetical protein
MMCGLVRLKPSARPAINASSHRNRHRRLTADSPDLLAVIKAAGKV